MRYLLKGSLTIAICLSLCCTSSKRSTFESPGRSSVTPEFKDNGKTIDSLKTIYGFESVEYENWEEDDKTDSSFTVCFINSKKLPQKDINETVNEFKAIASSIHRSVLYQDRYKSYYIIFVAREKRGLLLSTDSHTAGMDVSVREL